MSHGYLAQLITLDQCITLIHASFWLMASTACNTGSPRVETLGKGLNISLGIHIGKDLYGQFRQKIDCAAHILIKTLGDIDFNKNSLGVGKPGNMAFISRVERFFPL